MELRNESPMTFLNTMPLYKAMDEVIIMTSNFCK